VGVNHDGEGDEFVVLNLDESGEDEGDDENDNESDADSGFGDDNETIPEDGVNDQNVGETTDDDDIIILNKTEADSPDTVHDRRTPINAIPDPTAENPDPIGDHRTINQITRSEINHILEEKPDRINYPGGRPTSPDQETKKEGPQYIQDLDWPLTKAEQEEHKRMYIDLFDSCDQCRKELEEERMVIGLLRHQYVHVRTQVIIDNVEGDIHKEPRILDSFSMNCRDHESFSAYSENPTDYWNYNSFYESMIQMASRRMKTKFPFDIFERLGIDYELNPVAIQYTDVNNKTITLPRKGPLLTQMKNKAPKHVQQEGEWGGFTQYEAFSGAFNLVMKCKIDLTKAEKLKFEPAEYALAKRIKYITDTESQDKDVTMTLGKLLLAYGAYKDDQQYPEVIPAYHQPLTAKCDADTAKYMQKRDLKISNEKYFSRNSLQKSASGTYKNKSRSDENISEEKCETSKSSSTKRSKNSPHYTSKKIRQNSPNKESKNGKTTSTKYTPTSLPTKPSPNTPTQSSTVRTLMKETDPIPTSLEPIPTNSSRKRSKSTQPQFPEAKPYQYLSGLRINRGHLTAHSRLGPMSYAGRTTLTSGATRDYTTYSQARPTMRNSTYLNTSSYSGSSGYNINENWRRQQPRPFNWRSSTWYSPPRQIMIHYRNRKQDSENGLEKEYSDEKSKKRKSHDLTHKPERKTRQ